MIKVALIGAWNYQWNRTVPHLQKANTLVVHSPLLRLYQVNDSLIDCINWN